MAQWSFWQAAQRDPDHLALVEPDGRELTAGELLAGANQVVHGLRALGLSTGDTVATLLPNSAEMVELYLACLQARQIHLDHRGGVRQKRGDRVACPEAQSPQPVDDPVRSSEQFTRPELAPVRFDKGQMIRLALRRLPEAPLGHRGRK